MPAHLTDPEGDGGSSGLDPTNPTDTSPLLIEQRWAGEGRTGDFTVLAGARLRCETTLSYGPEADPDTSDFVAAVPRDPRRSTLPTGPGAVP